MISNYILFLNKKNFSKITHWKINSFSDQMKLIFVWNEFFYVSKVGETLSNQTAVFTQNLQSLVDNLSNAAKDNKGLQETAERLNSTLRQLVGEQNAAEAEQATAELSGKVKDAVSTVVDEASKIAKNVETETAPIREEVQAATKKAVDQAVELAKYLQQQIQSAVTGSTPAPSA